MTIMTMGIGEIGVDNFGAAFGLCAWCGLG